MLKWGASILDYILSENSVEREIQIYDRLIYLIERDREEEEDFET